MKDCRACEGSGRTVEKDLRSAMTGVVISKGGPAKCGMCDGSGRVPNSFRSGLFRYLIDCESCGKAGMGASTRYCPNCGNNLWN